MKLNHNVDILFVDDEPAILSAVKRLLRSSPYNILLAVSAAEALEIMEKRRVEILVTDLKMPGMDGLSLLQIVKNKYPDTIRMALSAVTAAGQLLPCINSGEIFRYLTKPIDPGDLRTALKNAVEYYLVRKDRIALVNELQDKNQKYRRAFRRLMEAKSRQEKLVGELRGAMERINQLSGLLPICTGCKKIRDENGQWHEIEVYIRNHSDADFSHGLCPDCMKKYYPEYYEKIQARKNSFTTKSTKGDEG